MALNVGAALAAAEKALTLINIVAGYAKLASQIGKDSGPYLAFIQRISAAATVTRADVEELHAMSKPYLDMLNDTSRDVK